MDVSGNQTICYNCPVPLTPGVLPLALHSVTMCAKFKPKSSLCPPIGPHTRLIHGRQASDTRQPCTTTTSTAINRTFGNRNGKPSRCAVKAARSSFSSEKLLAPPAAPLPTNAGGRPPVLSVLLPFWRLKSETQVTRFSYTCSTHPLAVNFLTSHPLPLTDDGGTQGRQNGSEAGQQIASHGLAPYTCHA